MMINKKFLLKLFDKLAIHLCRFSLHTCYMFSGILEIKGIKSDNVIITLKKFSHKVCLSISNFELK